MKESRGDRKGRPGKAVEKRSGGHDMKESRGDRKGRPGKAVEKRSGGRDMKDGPGGREKTRKGRGETIRRP